MRQNKSILDALTDWTARIPTKDAFIILDDGETIGERLSYEKLYTESQNIGFALAKSLKKKQTPVLMLYPPGLAFIKAFLACQFSRNIAIPIFPPRSGKHLDRLLTIMQNSGSRTILTISSEAEKIRSWLKKFDVNFITVIATDDIEANVEAQNLGRPELEDVAFIQYTSGSTGLPKGVTITNENLMANELLIQKMSALEHDDILLNWLPFYHDMGLIGNILFNIYNGSTCYLMTPFDFIKKPIRWFKAISNFDVTVSGGPNFAYDLCVEKIQLDKLEGVDLTKWKMAFNGAEPVREDTLKEFTEKFSAIGFDGDAFFPCYGLAEATLFVSGGGARGYRAIATDEWETPSGDLGFESGSIKKIVSAGKLWREDIDVKIVNPETNQVCKSGEIGEIWISGKSVTKGYWNSDLEVHADIGDRSYFKTGDLGTIYQEELFITGRLKEMIIIHGQNFYPYDIEKIVGTTVPSIHNNGVAAFAVEQDKKERLVVVAELKREAYMNPDLQGIFSQVQKEIINFLNVKIHDVVLLKPFEIPRTSSGKIMRLKCKKMYLKNQFAECPSKLNLADQLEKETPVVQESTDSLPMRDFIKVCLEKLSGDKINTLKDSDQILDFGLDSINVLAFSNLLLEQYGKEVDIKTIFEGATIADVEKVLKEDQAKLNGAAAQEIVTTDAVSPNQKSLWYLEKINPAIENNIGLFLSVKGTPDIEKWQKNLLAIINRHEALRTSFLEKEGDLIRLVNDTIEELPILAEEAEGLEKGKQRVQELFELPFDLAQAPLLRLIVIRVAPDHHLISFCCHHINSDGWSMNLLFSEFYALLNEETLPEQVLPFSQFVAYENQQINAEEFGQAVKYYTQLLDSKYKAARFLNLPAINDTTEDAKPYQVFALDKSLVQQASKSLQTSPFIFLLSVYHLIISLYANSQEIITASPVSRREKGAWSNTIGYFSNLQYLRSDISYDSSFSEIVKNLKSQFLETLKWQSIPYSKIIEQVFDSKEVDKKAMLNQFLFTYQSVSSFDLFKQLFSDRGLQTANLEIENLDIAQQTNTFDLSFEVFDNGKELFGFVKYRNKEASPIFKQLLDNFSHITTLLSENNTSKLKDLFLLEPTQNEKLLQFSEGPKRQSTTNYASVIEAFEAQVTKTPGNVALIYGGQKTTYWELNANANQLASYLKANYQISSEDLIALKLPRDKWLITSILAVLKTGAAYVPIDPTYPEDRQKIMEEDSGAKLVLNEAEIAEFLEIRHDFCPVNAKEKPAANQLAYVLYTSGTSGRPKGVMIEHGAVLDYTETVIDYFSITDKDVIIQQSSVSFDTMVEELFPCLLTGGQALLLQYGGKDIESIIDSIENKGASIISTTPLVLNALNETLEDTHNLRIVISGGDLLEVNQISNLLQKDVAIYNTYGPTETTVCATYAKIESADDVKSIGAPIANKSVLILNENGMPAPQLVEGEIYIGGSGLARGYWNSPEMTAQKFVDHPFKNNEKIYRTGDLGRWLPNGQIEFLGRIDDQVKIRGHRIELAEVESTLGQHPDLKTALVAARNLNGKGKVLIAFYLSDKELTSAELRDFMKQKVPAYMVPTFFVAIDEIPLTPSGKVDRKALELPSEMDLFNDANYLAPTNDREKRLVEIWSTVLNLPKEKIGILDDFFELGGESLLLMKVKNSIEINFGLVIDIATLLKAFNIKAIAAYLDSVQLLMEVESQDSSSENEILEI